ncbi:hypothetical protein BDF14DRAFT_1810649 [Spinellus fusiger]|nr:hypothetical protein BDF14DRAFT_1810649 [Spinellus fusiger]
MAVLPLNSSSKLDQEPNPFEQSFSGAAEKKDKEKPMLPPVASMTSPAVSLIGGGVLPKEVTNQFTWDTLRTGPLSPSMLQGPTEPDEFRDYGMHTKAMSHLSVHSQSHPQSHPHPHAHPHSHPHSHAHPHSQRPPSAAGSYDPTHSAKSYSQVKVKHESEEMLSDDTFKSEKTRKSPRRRSREDEEALKKRRTKEKTPEDEEKRKNFLERNRIAALKCRQRKKQWLSNLQGKVEYLSGDNDRLQMQAEQLREEIMSLKTLLLAHKDCPIAQANGFDPNTVKPIPHLMRPSQPIFYPVPSASPIPAKAPPSTSSSPTSVPCTQFYTNMRQQQSMVAGAGVLRF